MGDYTEYVLCDVARDTRQAAGEQEAGRRAQVKGGGGRGASSHTNMVPPQYPGRFASNVDLPLLHRIAHCLGWNRGVVESWFDGDRLMVGD